MKLLRRVPAFLLPAHLRLNRTKLDHLRVQYLELIAQNRFQLKVKTFHLLPPCFRIRRICSMHWSYVKESLMPCIR